jgi:hypothetical protein
MEESKMVESLIVYAVVIADYDVYEVLGVYTIKEEAERHLVDAKKNTRWKNHTYIEEFPAYYSYEDYKNKNRR